MHATFLGKCSVISCVAVAVTLLLLSILDIWKLELGLAPYSITAAVGALTLAIVITKKYWVTERSIPDTNRDKSHRRLERPLQLEIRHGSNDSKDIFSLPQNLQVMVSNYLPLQEIFAISENTRETRTDKQFSPIVTIVNATQQPLDCVLLLRGENPPKVNCRTLFCYIAVQVSNFGAHGLPFHPPYHMESKPCNQNKLPLTFSFHQPGIVCVIQLSVHSIVDSEGVEYMHHSEGCTCIVQIIDNSQYQCYSGAGRVKEHPLVRCSGELATKRYHKFARLFKKLYLYRKTDQILQLAKRIIHCRSINLDIKIDAKCWKACIWILQPKKFKRCEKLFRVALKEASLPDCQNGVLLLGMILKHLGYMQYVQGNDDEAQEYISAAREILANAAPSQITAQVLFIGLMIKWRKILSTPQSLSIGSLNESVEEDFGLLRQHAQYMEEYYQPDVFHFLMEKTSFHLRSSLIEDELPPKAIWPTQNDLCIAKQCLHDISLDMLPNREVSIAALYYHAHCDLCLWNQKYLEAINYDKLGKELCSKTNVRIGINRFKQRLRLIQRLMLNEQKEEKENEEFDAILREFSDEAVQS